MKSASWPQPGSFIMAIAVSLGTAGAWAAGDVPVAPAANVNLGTIKLRWDIPQGNVTGYRVYYGNASRQYVQMPGSGIYSNVNSVRISGLISGQIYYFSVRALDSAGIESGYSDEGSKPAP